MRKGMREEPNEDEEGDREEEPRGAASFSAWSQCHSAHWSNRLSGFALAESAERVCVAEQAAREDSLWSAWRPSSDVSLELKIET